MNTDQSMQPAGHAGKAAAIIILASIGVALFWQIMALRSSAAVDGFVLTAADFADYEPSYPGYTVISVPVSSSPTEPNIVAYRLHAQSSRNKRAFVRLAHGYNMRDCMRYKDYEVDLLEDGRMPGNRIAARVQIWRLTDPAGEQALWMTTMLRASDFAPLDIDTRSMPFPSIGAPVDPGWSPRGLTRDSLRRPLYNMRMYMRAKWNNARRDPATFLRLRRPAWASAEVLTLVSGTLPAPDGKTDPLERRNEILAHHLRGIEQLINRQGRQ